MPTYVFKGRNRMNEVVSGERVADNREALRQVLRREQVTLTSVKEKGREIGIPKLSGRKKVKSKDLAIFLGLLGPGEPLPLPTRIVVGFSNFLAGWGGLSMLVVIIGSSVGINFYYKTPKGRKRIDTILLKTPILGPIFLKIAIARFSRTLSTLLSSGVPILQSLDITARTSGNVVIEEAIMSVRTAVEQGKSFVEPLRAADIFPHMVSQMVGIGEQTGALDAMLGKIADFYEQEVDAAIANLLTLIEPVLIGFLGVTIGSIVIAMYMPMFSLIGKLSQGH